jgi:hypothetical protein
LRALRVLGPGLITGASDDDPSGIGTYSQAGSQGVLRYARLARRQAPSRPAFYAVLTLALAGGLLISLLARTTLLASAAVAPHI